MRTPNIENIKRLPAAAYPETGSFRCVEVIIPDDDQYLWVLAGMISILGFNWAWYGTPEERESRARIWAAAYALTKWGSCMNCEELTACLQPLFEAISAEIAALQTTVDNVMSAIEESAAKPPEPIIEPVTNAVCGGATAVVEQMNNTILQTYAESEASGVQNVFEAIPIIIELIPAIGALPFDELYELVNTIFENQVEDYTADYEAIKNDLICDLRCHIEQLHDGEFNFEIWAEWLDYVGENYPGNRAASIFSRFSPTAQTFINQIAALLNGDQSLQSYFVLIYQVYFAGTQNPVVCIDCDCELCEFEVQANIDPDPSPFGQDSGIAVVMGTEYEITATGLWSYGAGGDFDAEGQPGTSGNPMAVLPAANLGQLIWKVGAGGTWAAGLQSFSETMPASGNLFFAMNDVPGAYHDNSGVQCIIVEEVV